VDESQKGKLFVVSGPSGSGKSTLVRRAVNKTQVQLSISATTRPRGEKETDGKDYYFIDKEEFEKKIKAGEFLEYAMVFDHYYGTPAGPVNQMLEKGKTVVLEIDIQGALQVFKSVPEAEGVLILPPNDKELRRRLESRGRDDAETINKRLAKAQWEIEQAVASGNYNYVVVNDDLDESTKQISQILTGEKKRPPDRSGG